MKNILAIETSCDETAIAILSFEEKNKTKKNRNNKKEKDIIIDFDLLSNKILSQINIHREFGGVFPSLAKREHAKNIIKIFIESLKEAKLFSEKKDIVTNNNYEKKLKQIEKLFEREIEMFLELKDLFLKIEKPNINYIAITSGPGLAPALWIGINFAKAISIFWNIPIYEINHMEGHIISALIKTKENKKYFIQNVKSNNLSLLISGGHTEIIYFNKNDFKKHKYKKIGFTLDDAVGEAFDKTARSLNLSYPGGPEISKLADIGRNQNIKIEKSLSLPRPMIYSNNFNFSFSGIKTSVIYLIKKINNKNQNEILEKNTILNINENDKIKIALDFENAITEILIYKTKKAIEKYKIENLIIGGGVSANKNIRQAFEKLCIEKNISLHLPEKNLTGDNAFMIGATALIQIIHKKPKTNLSNIIAKSNWSIEEL